MAAHTPEDDWRIDWATYGGPYIREPVNGYEIAKVYGSTFEEKKERAEFLRAAPAMLEALQDLATCYPIHLLDDHTDDQMVPTFTEVGVLRKVFAAIAAATSTGADA